jgi:hypothetical protein
MKNVIIYQPSKTAMQSGRLKTHFWILEYAIENSAFKDSCMGWIGTTDNKAQVKLKFKSLEEAVAYAKKNHLSYKVLKSHAPRLLPKSYAENFMVKDFNLPQIPPKKMKEKPKLKDS